MNTGLFATLKELPRPVWILFAGTFVNRFGAFVIPFLALYLTQRGFTRQRIALALAAYGVGHLLAAVLGGYLTDRIGRRKTIGISMLGSAAAMLLLSQAERFSAMVSLTLLTGLAGELYRPASSALLADLIPAGSRVTAFATYRLAINAGWAFGPATAGFLAKYDFFWLFLGDAATSAAFGLIALVGLPRGLRGAAGEARWSHALRLMRRDRHLQVMLAANLAIALVFMQMSSTFGLQVTAQHLPASVYGLLISLNGVLVVLFELPLTRLTATFPARPTIAAGYVLIGIGFALAGLASSAAGFVGAVVAFTAGEMIAMPVNLSYIADSVPEDMRGRYMGAFAFVWALGLIAGPSGGVLLFASRPDALWITCGSLGAIAAALILRTGSPAAQRRAAMTPQ